MRWIVGYLIGAFVVGVIATLADTKGRELDERDALAGIIAACVWPAWLLALAILFVSLRIKRITEAPDAGA